MSSIIQSSIGTLISRLVHIYFFIYTPVSTLMYIRFRYTYTGIGTYINIVINYCTINNTGKERYIVIDRSTLLYYR
jgi:hypothetical protein